MNPFPADPEAGFLLRTHNKRLCKMKKLLFVLFLLGWAGTCFAAGSCVVTAGNRTDMTAEIIWTCTGDSVDGSIPNTSAGSLSSLFVKYPYALALIIENLAADANVTANSDVYLYDKSANGADLLAGSGVDGLDDSTRNYVRLTAAPLPQQVWLGVANQAGASGKYTVILTISRMP